MDDVILEIREEVKLQTTTDYQIRLSPYAKVFYNEWLLDPHTTRYNMLCADQLLFGKLNVERLERALKRYTANSLLLNSHIKAVSGEPYWMKNSEITSLEYSAKPVHESSLLEFVNRTFDLHNDALYRFRKKRLAVKEELDAFRAKTGLTESLQKAIDLINKEQEGGV